MFISLLAYCCQHKLVKQIKLIRHSQAVLLAFSHLWMAPPSLSILSCSSRFSFFGTLSSCSSNSIHILLFYFSILRIACKQPLHCTTLSIYYLNLLFVFPKKLIHWKVVRSLAILSRFCCHRLQPFLNMILYNINLVLRDSLSGTMNLNV